MKISDIKKQSGGSIVDGTLVAVLSEVGEHSQLKDPDGASYTSQRAKLSQGGEWIFVEFSNLGDVSCCNGREIELACTTTQHGTQGVTLKAVVRGDKTFKNLRITPSAKFLVGKEVQSQALSKRAQLKAERK